MAKPQQPDVVRLDIDADEIHVRRFLAMASNLVDVLQEVDREVAPGAGVSWLVESISRASPLILEVRPTVSEPTGRQAVTRNLVRTVNSGIRQVQERAVRPANFTDRALEKAKALVESASTGSAVVRIGTVDEPTQVDSKLIANVDTILGATISSIGTIEGTLEALNVHGTNRYFNVYDALTGDRIRCDFGHRIDSREIGKAVERRVAVHGEIRYRDNGEIVNVIARTLEMFPDEDQLPSAASVRGILRT